MISSDAGRLLGAQPLEKAMKQTIKESAPDKMRVLELTAYGPEFKLRTAEKPVPSPGADDVLVRIDTNPINPADLMFMRGTYIYTKSLPTVPGIIASGTVVVSGGSLLGRFLLGKRVVCASPQSGDGTWAEYMTTPARMCMPLRKYMDMEQGSNLYSNPATAWGLMAEARKGKHRAIVQTAAAGDLGRIVIHLGKRFGVPTINIVRRPEQVELLKSLGAEHVLDSEDAGFDTKLKELCERLNATMAFECVAGDMPARLSRAMPAKSRICLYGSLSGKDAVAGNALISKKQYIDGFSIYNWLGEKSFLAQLSIMNSVQDLFRRGVKMEIRERVSLESAAKNMQQYSQNATAGKILIKPALK